MKNGKFVLGALLLIGAAGGAVIPAAEDAPAKECPISVMMGGGNFTGNKVDETKRRQFRVLQQLGAGMCRVNLYPGDYLINRDWSKPRADALDSVLKAAHEHGVIPMILFEYYAEYKAKQGLGNYDQWFAIGKTFAERYRPNGTWGRENGIRDWGITIYSAFNEPERGFGKGGKLGPEPYVAALKGLADGVHSVDKRLKVLPGGFMAANAWNDWTLRGLGPALAPLWNDGTLDGIDLHTYYDIAFAPMEGTYKDSAQSNFDDVKKACGITRDINFYATEFNYKKREVTEEQAARGFLTGIWDNLGVVKQDGSGATTLAFPWNIFHDAEKDKHYGLSRGLDTYVPTSRGKVLQMVLDLTKGMTFASRDPRKTGEYVLTGNGKKLWIWQNRKAWTNYPGSAYTVKEIPAGVKQIAIYGWDGLRQTVDINGQTSLTIGDLPGDETYLFLAKFPA